MTASGSARVGGERRGGGAADPSPEGLRAENERLRRAVHELSLLNETAQAVATARDLPTVLRRIVRRAVEAVGAEQGSLALLDRQRDLRARTAVRTAVGTSRQAAFHANDLLIGWTLIHRRPLRAENPEADERLRGAGWDPAVRSLLSAPLVVHGEPVGLLVVYNKRGAAGFSAEDERLLAILAGQSAQVVEVVRTTEERDRVLRLFGQHTAPAVVDELVRAGAEPPSRRQHVCVLALALKGFTDRAEAWPPEETVAHLNMLFSLSVEEVARRRGVVHHLLGDGLVAVFGAPLASETDGRDGVEAALALAARIGAAVDVGALPETPPAIGVDAGEAVAGVVGAAHHREYRVTGAVMQRAARLRDLCAARGDRVLASSAAWERAGGPAGAEALGQLRVPGRAAPVEAYRLA
jgi:class 3 adenylate cyclase